MPKKRGKKKADSDSEELQQEVSFDEKALINDVLDTEESMIDYGPTKKTKKPVKKRKPKKAKKSKKGLDSIVEGEALTGGANKPVEKDEIKPLKTGGKAAKTEEPKAELKPKFQKEEEQQEEIRDLRKLKNVLDAARTRRFSRHKHTETKAAKPPVKTTSIPEEREIKELFQEKTKEPVPELYKEKSMAELAPAQKKLHPEPFRFFEQDDVSHKWELEKAMYNYPKVHKRRVLKLTLITLLLAVLFAFILLKSGFFEPDAMHNIPQTSNEPTLLYKTILINRTINESKPINISFDRDLERRGYMEGDISLIGFLRYDLQRIPGAGISRHVYSIVDDYNMSIVLSDLNDQQEQLFTREETTTALFNVSGTMRTVNNQLQLRVESISHAERPAETVSRIVTEEKKVLAS